MFFTSLLSLQYKQGIFFPPLGSLTLVVMHDTFPFSTIDLYISVMENTLYTVPSTWNGCCALTCFELILKHLWPSLRKLFLSPADPNSRTFGLNQDVCKPGRQSQDLNAVAFVKAITNAVYLYIIRFISFLSSTRITAETEIHIFHSVYVRSLRLHNIL